MRKILLSCAWSLREILASGTRKRWDFRLAPANSVAKGGTTSWIQGLNAVALPRAKNGLSFCARWVKKISGLRLPNIYPAAPTTQSRTTGMSSWTSRRPNIWHRPKSSNRFSSEKSNKEPFLIHISCKRQKKQATVLVSAYTIISFWPSDTMSRSNLEKTCTKKLRIRPKAPLN